MDLSTHVAQYNQFFVLLVLNKENTCIGQCIIPNLVNGRRFIAIRRKVMKIWAFKLADFYEKWKQLASLTCCTFMTLQPFLTKPRIFRTPHNISSGEASILSEWKKKGKAWRRFMSIMNDLYGIEKMILRTTVQGHTCSNYKFNRNFLLKSKNVKSIFTLY